MNNAMVEIGKWAVNLSFWEQVALDKIISGKELTDSDYDELLQILLEDSELTEKQVARPTLTIYEKMVEEPKSISSKKLSRIENLENINALVPGQTMTFSPSLTAIFGGNGSGKSGYARVLANAGFTRGDREVLPNVTKPINADQTLSADLVISENGVERTIHFPLGTSCPDLQSFYVFDSTSVRVHMNEANQLSFSPAGLSFLTDLANATDEVRSRLNARIDEYNQSPSFMSLFQGESNVTKVLLEIGVETDEDYLESLSVLSSDEKKRLGEITIAIANAELDEFHAQIEDLQSKLHALKVFRDQLIEAQTLLRAYP